MPYVSLSLERRLIMADIIRISFTEQINVSTVRTFIEELERCNAENPDCTDLYITIASPGGDVELAIELYNFIRSLNCKVTTINLSYVNSAAIIVYLSGEERLCFPSSSFFVHSITKRMNKDYTISELLREVKEMKANTEKVSALLESQTFKDKSYWKKMMGRGEVIGAVKSVQLGLVNRIIDSI